MSVAQLNGTFARSHHHPRKHAEVRPDVEVEMFGNTDCINVKALLGVTFPYPSIANCVQLPKINVEPQKCLIPCKIHVSLRYLHARQ